VLKKALKVRQRRQLVSMLLATIASRSGAPVRPYFCTARSIVTWTSRATSDNGSEFISKALNKWAYSNQVTLDFSRPGKPTDNPFIESFNGKGEI
jgi:transposase InsO family protein